MFHARRSQDGLPDIRLEGHPGRGGDDLSGGKVADVGVPGALPGRVAVGAAPSHEASEQRPGIRRIRVGRVNPANGHRVAETGGVVE